MLSDVNIFRLLKIMGAPWCFSTGAPVKIIFDTDMDTDCDDAVAAAMIRRYVLLKNAVIIR